MSSKIDKPSSERPGENVTPNVAAARLIRSQALLTTRTESTGHISPIVDKLNYDEAKGETDETLPDDMAQDDIAGGPPSQSPIAQLRDEEYCEKTGVVLECYEEDTTAVDANPDSVEAPLIEAIDARNGGAEDNAEEHVAFDAGAKDSADATPSDIEELTPGGTVVRRKHTS